MRPKRRAKSPTQTAKKVTKLDSEQSICRTKLEALDRVESLSSNDRFSFAEKKTLLDAYNDHGFQVFQNASLLKQYIPDRKETELKDLIERLQTKLAKSPDNSQSETQNLVEWTQLAQRSINTLSRTKKIHMDNVVSDTMLYLTQSNKQDPRSDDLQPNYSKIMCNISQLMLGRFPDKLSSIDAQISRRLFEDLNRHVDTLGSKDSLKDGTWLKTAIEDSMSMQTLALGGLDKLDGTANKCPTPKDLDSDREIEALCLELPKIKRITDTLNPLYMS